MAWQGLFCFVTFHAGAIAMDDVLQLTKQYRDCLLEGAGSSERLSLLRRARAAWGGKFPDAVRLATGDAEMTALNQLIAELEKERADDRTHAPKRSDSPAQKPDVGSVQTPAK
jgi:hypothetical protein